MNPAQALQDLINEAYLKLPNVNRETYPVAQANITYGINGVTNTITYTITMPITTDSGTNGELTFATKNWLPA